jgi:ABC-type maltose transport system permease subunit
MRMARGRPRCGNSTASRPEAGSHVQRPSASRGQALLPLLMVNGAPSTKTLTLAACTFVGQYNTDWQYTMTAVVLAVLPSIIVFILLQKHIVKGVTAGAVKG